MEGTAGSCLSFLIKQCLQIFTTQKTSKSNIQQKNKKPSAKKKNAFLEQYLQNCMSNPWQTNRICFITINEMKLKNDKKKSCTKMSET